MPLNDYSDFIEDEMALIGLPCSYKVEIIYNKYGRGRFWIPISIGTEEEIADRNPSSSYFDFWFCPRDKEIFGINNKLNLPLQGKGFGRKIFEVVEKFAKHFCCTRIVININTNPEYWEHLGFRMQERDNKIIWVKELSDN